MSDQTTATQQDQTQGPTAEELQERLRAIEAENEALKRERTQLTSRLDRLEAALIEAGVRGAGEAEDTAKASPPAQPEPEAEPDFDNMSAKDMVRYVLGKFDEKLGRATSAMQQQIQQAMVEAQAARLVDEVSAVIQLYGEDTVTKHQQAVIGLMAKNPELTIEEALLIAARRAGEELAPRGGSKKPETPPAEEGLPPRGTARPAAHKEPPPSNFVEAGQRAWKQLGLKF